MEKDKTSAPVEDNNFSREQQAQAIMRQLVDAGIFAPDEAAEITFSDTQFICVPDKQSMTDKKA